MLLIKESSDHSKPRLVYMKSFVFIRCRLIRRASSFGITRHVAGIAMISYDRASFLATPVSFL
jgi:hypothetical protein